MVDCPCDDCACPCVDCICIPVCRHRTLAEMQAICKLVADYYRFPFFRYKKDKLRSVLNPTPDVWADVI